MRPEIEDIEMVIAHLTGARGVERQSPLTYADRSMMMRWATISTLERLLPNDAAITPVLGPHRERVARFLACAAEIDLFRDVVASIRERCPGFIPEGVDAGAEFRLGQSVQTRLAPNRTPRRGIVWTRRWHSKNEAWFYTLLCDGRPISRRYFAVELEPDESAA